MKIHRYSRRAREDSGVALLFALIAAMTVLTATAIVALQMNTAKHRTDMAVSQLELDEAAKAGLDAGIERFWTASSHNWRLARPPQWATMCSIWMEWLPIIRKGLIRQSPFRGRYSHCHYVQEMR